MTDADDLLTSVTRRRAEVRCREGGHLVAEVYDSPHGPLLVLQKPDGWLAKDPVNGLKMLRLAKAVTVDGRTMHPRQGDRVPAPTATRIRAVMPDDWTAQDLHCDHHGALTVSRSDLVAALQRYPYGRRVARVHASQASRTP